MRKIFLFIISGALFLIVKNFFFSATAKTVAPGTDSTKATTLYDIKLKKLDGTGDIDFNAFRGKKILIVNTASECGFTPQYEGLEKLSIQMKEKLVIIGCPCNQFGGQEPEDSSGIRNFCTKNFGVTFPISEKLDVKGKDQHPLFKWLTNKSENGLLDSEVRWNFNKYLIGEDGKLLAYYPSRVKPDDEELLKMIAK